ncbi:MAG: hypothetical protein ACT4QB_23375 [Gammaproteobacteria bacterium]
MKTSIAASRRNDLSEPGLSRSAAVIGLPSHIEDVKPANTEDTSITGRLMDRPGIDRAGIARAGVGRAGGRDGMDRGGNGPGGSAVGAFIATPVGELRRVRHRIALRKVLAPPRSCGAP